MYEFFFTFAPQICGDGVIGSRVRLRIWCRKTCGFESHSPHTEKPSLLWRLFCCVGFRRLLWLWVLCAGREGVTLPLNPGSARRPSTITTTPPPYGHLPFRRGVYVASLRFLCGEKCSSTPPNLPFRRGGFFYAYTLGFVVGYQEVMRN